MRPIAFGPQKLAARGQRAGRAESRGDSFSDGILLNDKGAAERVSTRHPAWHRVSQGHRDRSAHPQPLSSGLRLIPQSLWIRFQTTLFLREIGQLAVGTAESEFADTGTDSECGFERICLWNQRRGDPDTVRPARPDSNRHRSCDTSNRAAANRAAASRDCMRPRPTSSSSPEPNAQPVLLFHFRSSILYTVSHRRKWIRQTLTADQLFHNRRRVA